MEVFILEVNISEIPKFCHIIWGIDILFEKLSPEIGGWIWETPFAHYAGLVQSGKVGKKAVVFSKVREGQEKSGKVREFFWSSGREVSFEIWESVNF